jgi:hypothetical protein
MKIIKEITEFLRRPLKERRSEAMLFTGGIEWPHRVWDQFAITDNAADIITAAEIKATEWDEAKCK